YEVVKEAAESVRKNSIPILIEAKTYRYKGHSKSDLNLYRTKEEIEEWKKKDPIDNFSKKLKDMGILTDERIIEIDREIESEIESAVEFAKSSPEPILNEALDLIYYKKGDML
ncbi:MAG: thiamine pyrophosphate-dependent enzyme, partial [bacterium]